MKRGQSALFAGAFLLVMVGLMAVHLYGRPRILVVHSYDADFPWTRDLNAGLGKVFAAGRRMLDVHWHYLNSNDYWAEPSREVEKRAVERAVAEFRPQVLVAFDDEAQALVARNFVGRSDLAVVFAGLDEEPDLYGYQNAGNITGVLERLPLPALRDLLDQIGAGRPLRVAVLGDGSATARAEAAQMAAFDWAAHRLVGDRQAADFPAWQQEVAALDGQADVLFLAGYRRVARTPGSAKAVPGPEVVAWTEGHARALPVAAKLGFVADGGALALTISAREQAEVAGSLALAIVQGAAPGSLPIRTGTQFTVAMSAGRLAARGVRLPTVYESAARAAGQWQP